MKIMNNQVGTQRLLRLMGSGCCVLAEGAIVERIKRLEAEDIQLDPVLAHAPLVYTAKGRRALAGLHRQYLEIGRRRELPMLTFTDTWRANSARMKEAGLAGKEVNGDCVRFLREIVSDYGAYADMVFIGGLIGCKGDAYRPVEALSKQEALAFHRSQVDALTAAEVDFLFAATIPSLSEAIGMAAAMASSGVPYVVSFVLNRVGLILDGTPLNRAISLIDRDVSPPPLFYMANCCHPSFYEAALKNIAGKDNRLLDRIIGLQANTSLRDADELDKLGFLDSEDPDVFADLMIDLHQNFGTRILGGCCGTDDRHIEAIAERFKAAHNQVKRTR
jgi:homocysteine S-methyltransferase